MKNLSLSNETLKDVKTRTRNLESLEAVYWNKESMVNSKTTENKFEKAQRQTGLPFEEREDIIERHFVRQALQDSRPID